MATQLISGRWSRFFLGIWWGLVSLVITAVILFEGTPPLISDSRQDLIPLLAVIAVATTVWSTGWFGVRWLIRHPKTFTLLAAVVLGLVPAVFGIGVFIWQVLNWFREGTWNSFSLLEGWLKIGGNSPTEWVGVQRLLTALPLSLSLIAFGGLMIATFASEIEAIQRRADVFTEE